MKVWRRGIALMMAMVMLAGCQVTEPSESVTTGQSTGTELPVTTSVVTTETTAETTVATTVVTEETTTATVTETAEAVELPTVDRAGNPIELSAPAMEVAVMAPAYAQMMEGLGVLDRVVAVDTNTPAAVPELGELPQMDLFAPNAEVLIALQPDLVLASAISMAGGKDDPFQQIEDAGIPVAYIPTPDSLDGIAEDIQFVADVLGLSQEGEALVDEYYAKIRHVEEQMLVRSYRPRVLFEVAPAPDIYSFGSGVYLNEMMQRANIANVLADETGWLPVTEEAAIEAAPDIIFTASNWLPDPVQDILDRPAWQEVPAVKEGKVFYIENNWTQIPSQYVADGMEAMAKVSYSDFVAYDAE